MLNMSKFAGNITGTRKALFPMHVNVTKRLLERTLLNGGQPAGSALTLILVWNHPNRRGEVQVLHWPMTTWGATSYHWVQLATAVFVILYHSGVNYRWLSGWHHQKSLSYHWPGFKSISSPKAVNYLSSLSKLEPLGRAKIFNDLHIPWVSQDSWTAGD